MKKKATNLKRFLCAHCPAALDAASLSRGWKQIAGQILCPDCKAERYIVRAVVVPVLAPLTKSLSEATTTPSGKVKMVRAVAPLTWQEFDARMAGSYDAVRHLANWAMTELFRRDAHPREGDAKLGQMPKVYLYEALGKASPRTEAYRLREAWAGAMREASTVLQQCEKLYRQERYDVLWRGTRSLRCYRHDDMPLPIHNQSWSLALDGDGRPVVSLPLPAVGGDPIRAELLLDCGRGFGRQRSRIEQLAAGVAEPCEAAVYRRRASRGSHRHVGYEAAPGGARPYRTFVKLVGWFPKPQSVARPGNVLSLYTDPDLFWVLERDLGDRGRERLGVKLWQENGDHVRRRIVAHREYLRRIAEDMKYERRTNNRPAILAQMEWAREERCRNHQERVATFLDQSVAVVVGVAQRHHAAEVVYADHCRSYVPSFPWAMFRLRLADRLGAIGVRLLLADEECGGGELEAAAC